MIKKPKQNSLIIILLELAAIVALFRIAVEILTMFGVIDYLYWFNFV